jgi:neutral ceramidase
LARTVEVDFASVSVDADLADGQPHRTGPAEIGMAMFFGTEEGPGLPLGLLPAQAAIMKARQFLGRRRADPVQGDKVTWVQSGIGKVFGRSRLSRLPPLPLPRRLRAVLDQIRRLEGAAPWTPQVLPVQLVVLGEIAIAAAPGEFTTVAGRRVRKLVAEELRPLGVEEVVFAGYANDYAGYVVTPEEYALQNYEGASTHFGQWTLPAYLTVFRRLARQLRAEAHAS